MIDDLGQIVCRFGDLPYIRPSVAWHELVVCRAGVAPNGLRHQRCSTLGFACKLSPTSVTGTLCPAEVRCSLKPFGELSAMSCPRNWRKRRADCSDLKKQNANRNRRRSKNWTRRGGSGTAVGNAGGCDKGKSRCSAQGVSQKKAILSGSA